ncbi:MAG: hypothetical protein ACTHMS_13215 [Jatrophihabitans sp.]|uniref:hypothetical protein n=1 Tax=Jatrophihabitans sp. TaxID=1932789 RepID=UPI003F7FA625
MTAHNDGPVAAHDQTVAHRYVVHYPPHPARTDDPHYKDFNHYHRTTGPTARCAFAVHATLPGDQQPLRQLAAPHRLLGDGELRAGCDTCCPLELHHSHIEFSMQNGVDLALLEKDYPGVSSVDEVGAWVESAANLIWLCVFHHRGPGGAHTASASDYEAERYVRGLIGPADRKAAS